MRLTAEYWREKFLNSKGCLLKDSLPNGELLTLPFHQLPAYNWGPLQKMSPLP